MYRIWIRPKKAAQIVQLAEHVLLIKGSGVRIPGGSPGIGRPEMGGLLHTLFAGMAGARLSPPHRKRTNGGRWRSPYPHLLAAFCTKAALSLNTAALRLHRASECFRGWRRSQPRPYLP